MQITYSTPFTVGEILSQFEVNKELIEKSKPQASVKNTPYTPARWLGRILTADNALKPHPSLKHKIHYLHSYYELEEPQRSTYNQLQKFSNVFSIPNVVNRWMSTVFGFFEHNGDIVQINPADLFLYSIYWELPFDYALKDARVISIPETSGENWVREQLGYYLLSLLRLEPYEQELTYWNKRQSVVKTNDEGALYGYSTMVDLVPSSEFAQCWIVTNLLNRLTYMKDAKVSKSALMSHLLPLGDVVAFGWSSSFQVEYSHLNIGDPVAISEYEGKLKDHGITRYAQGMWHKKFKPPLLDKSSLEFVSQERTAVNKLLHKFYKKSPKVIKTDLVSAALDAGIYSPIITNKKSWFKEHFVHDAEGMDWILKEFRGRGYTDEGKETKVTYIELSKPKTRRRKKS